MTEDRKKSGGFKPPDWMTAEPHQWMSADPYQYPLFREDGGKIQYYLDKDLKQKRLKEKVWEDEWKAKTYPYRSKQEVLSEERLPEPEPDDQRSLVADLTILLREHCAGLLEASNAAVAIANLYNMRKK